MITIHDCYSQCDVRPDEIVIVAMHEHLPPILAVARAEELLRQPWGGPAILQMIRDEYVRAGRSGDRERAEDLADLYRQARRVYPHAHDRRRLPR